jgi:hypothetical protein
MPPRSEKRLLPEERPRVNRWSRRLLGCAAIIAIILAFPLFQQAIGNDMQAAGRPHIAACADWDDAASEAIVQLVKTRRDADLQLVGDAVFRMRRARRNCHMGWLRLACLDYQAITRGSPWLAEGFLSGAVACSVPDGEAIGNVVQRFTPSAAVTARRP